MGGTGQTPLLNSLGRPLISQGNMMKGRGVLSRYFRSNLLLPQDYLNNIHLLRLIVPDFEIVGYIEYSNINEVDSLVIAVILAEVETHQPKDLYSQDDSVELILLLDTYFSVKIPNNTFDELRMQITLSLGAR